MLFRSPLLTRHIHARCYLPFLKMGLEASIDFFSRLGFFVTCTDFFHILPYSLVEGLEVSKYQFQIDNLDITLRIDGSTHMVDTRVIEGSYDLEDRIDTPDMREELVPESFPFARSFDEACDIDEFDGCWDDPRTIDDLTNFFEPLIVHIDNTSIRLDRTEGEVRGFRGIGLGEGIEEGGFTDIGEADDSDLHGILRLVSEKKRS